MATVTAKPNVDLKVYFCIDEAEARALDALVGYGDDQFIKAFYEKLGTAYMRDHEAGLRKFFKTVREFMPSILNRCDSARSAFNGS